MMKLNIIGKILMLVNLSLTLLQLFLMGAFWDFYAYPFLNLMVPLIVLINVLFFVFWIFRMKWPLLLFVFSLLIGFEEWGRLYRLPNNGIPVSSGIKIMSFNVRLFNSYQWIKNKNVPEAIEDFVRQENPDVICLQEYSKEYSPKFAQYPYRYIKTSFVNGQNGLGIFSKSPLFNEEYIAFENSSNGAVFADMKYKNDTLRIYNVHLESLRINLKDTLFTTEHSQRFVARIQSVIQKQESQIDVFEKVDQKNNYPTIICTDLNNNGFSRVYKRIKKDRNDAYQLMGDGLGTTYQLANLPFRIDFIFADQRFKVINFTTYDTKLSDHKPIAAVLEWK